MDERRLELKVGALAGLALVIGLGLIVLLSGITGGHRFTLSADFAYAGGLPAGAAVKIAGVKVGRVSDVSLRPEGRDADGQPLPVRMTLEIDRAAATALRSDATASVGMQGALGESYVELLPGSAATPLPEHAVIRGIDPPRLDVLLARLAVAVEAATKQDALRDFLIELARIAHTLDQVLNNNRETLSAMLKNAAIVLEDARGAVGDLRTASKSANLLLNSPEVKSIIADFSQTARVAKTDLPGLLADTHALVAHLDKTAGALGPDDVAKVRETLARFDALGGQLQKVSSSADRLLSSIEKGDGTLGKAIRDPQVYDDLRSLLADLKAKPWKLVWKN